MRSPGNDYVVFNRNVTKAVTQRGKPMPRKTNDREEKAPKAASFKNGLVHVDDNGHLVDARG